ncbi:MAG: glycosyl hydrolase family 28-related protein [bacterium]|jgi:hypothetical protein|nr:glycosyl hydrolase family 28-related protein [bacterium]
MQSKFIAILAWALLSLMPAWAQDPSQSKTLLETVHSIYSANEYGAVGDGKTDDTAAIQSAIDAAAQLGGKVTLSAGQYLVAGSLEIKTGVVLAGVNEAPMAIAPLRGTVILATGGRGDESQPALFEMKQSSTVQGLTIWYPEQKPDDIVPYPWTIRMTGFDTTAENITLINSYNGIRTGPENNVRHRIRSVYGCVLRRGLFVDACTDIGRVENVQFHCHWWSNPETNGNWDLVYKYMGDNLEAFIFGRTDWEYVTNNFVFPAKIGYRFIQTENGACNGHFTGDGADSCQIAVQVDAIQPMGLLFTGGQFVSFLGDDPVEIVINPTCTGSVRFVNCAFWGPANHNAVIRGNGFTSFSDCYFSSSKQDAMDKPLLVVQSGRLQIHNSSFATPQPSIQLGPEVKHAIIQGNNGINGVRILGQAQASVIQNNEMPPVDTPQAE